MILSILMIILSSGCIQAADQSIAAFFSYSEVGKRITPISNKILLEKLQYESGLFWIAPESEIDAVNSGGIFLKPGPEKAEDFIIEKIRNKHCSHVVKYHIANAEINLKRNVSVPYVLNRFSRFFSVEICYDMIDISSMKSISKGSFDFAVEIDNNAQFFEYDPWRADRQIDAITEDKIINRAALKAAELILEHLQSMKEEANLEVSIK
ncbi:MAG: hypothetical protein CO189_09565 [candidate division Zixibacteria bacterium CG_4_9_14_3_um_filter_46_8]|nr:MAG: hypothetical protein CO189_09565 [candidate division Zixibacteria bacterium CG_4_9_14_3_um_filter_46_8]